MAFRALLAATLAMSVAGCAHPAFRSPAVTNPVGYFEIAVTDLDRATTFYEAVFEIDLERAVVDGYEMALFPATAGGPGATGALAKGDVYVPSRTGAILYFSVVDIDAVLARAVRHGGAVLYPRKAVPDVGYVAEFQDSEGNHIAVHAPPG